MDAGVVYVVHALFFLGIDLFVFGKAFSQRAESSSHLSFSAFALAVTLLQISAIGVICSEHGLVDFPLWGKCLLYFLLVVFPAVASYLASVWMFRLFALRKNKKFTKQKWFVAIPLIAYALVCLISFKTHWVFYIDESGAYRRGSLFLLQLLVPYSYVLSVFVYLLREKTSKGKFSLQPRAISFLLLYVIPPVFGSCVQVLMNLKGCFSELGLSVALVFVYIGMYMGDAEEHRHMKDLANFNRQLQHVNEKMRKLLMRGEMQAKTIAETIRGGFKIGRNDDAFSFKYVSEQFAQMLGYTVEELLSVSGGSLEGIVHPDDFGQDIPTLKNSEIYTVSYRLRCKDGSWKHVEERGRLIKTEGAEDEIWGVVFDKDEIVRTETALVNAENSRKKLAEYNDIITNAGLGVWFVTFREGLPSLLNGNEKFYELIGVDGGSMSEEDLHEYFSSRIIPEDVPIFGAAVEKMKSGQFAEALYRWNHPKLGIVYNRCGGTAVRLPDGAYCLRGYHGDATEIVANEQEQQELLKKALAAAEESSRAKTTFLNNMSHDIRTPMNAILGFASLIEKESDNPAKVKEYLKKVMNAGDFLLSLINNVLEMARIESGKSEVVESPVNLREMVEVTSSIFEASLKENHLTMNFAVNIVHENVCIDVVKMREISVNLLSNAVKYSVEGGTINVELTEKPCDKEGYAAYDFIFSDNGIGMAPDYLPHIFDSFVRERNSTESKIAGTGLGLPIVKKLVDLLGGTIEVESSLGKGTKFTLGFVHKICEENVVSEKSSTDAEKMDLAGLRVLFTEDNDLNVEIGTTLLEEVGFKVERAADGCECLEMLTKADPGYYDFILMDIQMPKMDGYETTRQIRKLPDSRKNIPIIATTANAFEEDRRAALEAGMNDHVTKPIDMIVLTKTISRILNGRK